MYEPSSASPDPPSREACRPDVLSVRPFQRPPSSALSPRCLPEPDERSAASGSPVARRSLSGDVPVLAGWSLPSDESSEESDPEDGEDEEGDEADASGVGSVSFSEPDGDDASDDSDDSDDSGESDALGEPVGSGVPDPAADPAGSGVSDVFGACEPSDAPSSIGAVAPGGCRDPRAARRSARPRCPGPRTASRRFLSAGSDWPGRRWPRTPDRRTAPTPPGGAGGRRSSRCRRSGSRRRRSRTRRPGPSSPRPRGRRWRRAAGWRWRSRSLRRRRPVREPGGGGGDDRSRRACDDLSQTTGTVRRVMLVATLVRERIGR